MSDSRKLKPRQVKAIGELIQGSRMGDVAHAVGVDVRTLNRWMSEPEFTRELRKRENGILTSIEAELVALSVDAVRALGEILATPSQAGANSRRLAAVAILETALRIREQIGLEERVSRLEERLLHGKN